MNESAPDEVVFVGENAPGLGDFLQVLNPLQHLPLIGTAYRALTGATIEPAARVVGGLIFGGPFGMISSLVNAVVAETSGGDIGDHMLAMVGAGKAPGGPTPPLPPSLHDKVGDGGGALQFASLAGPADNGGRIERGGLLTTWTSTRLSGSGEWARAEPPAEAPGAAAGTIPFPNFAARDRVSDTAQAAAVGPPTMSVAVPMAPPAKIPEPAMVDASRPSGRGKSLQDYRSGAVVPAAHAAPTPATAGHFSLAQRNEATRRLAAQTAILNLQQAADPAAEPQTYFSAAMAAGLDRYREMQRRRDAAAAPDAI